MVQDESDLEIHYGVAGPVRAWIDVEGFIIVEFEPADSLAEENWDCFAVDGFGGLEKSN